MPTPVDVLEHRNEVVLVGRLAAEPVPFTLPSGDELLSFRVIVERAAVRAKARPAPTQDTLACSAYTAGLRRTVGRWRAGDVVEVTGALRRRFRRTEAGPRSVHDIEVLAAKRLSRAAL